MQSSAVAPVGHSTRPRTFYDPERYLIITLGIISATTSTPACAMCDGQLLGACISPSAVPHVPRREELQGLHYDPNLRNGGGPSAGLLQVAGQPACHVVPPSPTRPDARTRAAGSAHDGPAHIPPLRPRRQANAGDPDRFGGMMCSTHESRLSSETGRDGHPCPVPCLPRPVRVHWRAGAKRAT